MCQGWYIATSRSEHKVCDLVTRMLAGADLYMHMHGRDTCFLNWFLFLQTLIESDSLNEFIAILSVVPALTSIKHLFGA